ncbi:MAG: hypothetical protein HY545_00580, partial [Candidatus Doudnabacteria bacterium]|nr:hypothetical protein [Candidatus Doudnabacteria bacterium]
DVLPQARQIFELPKIAVFILLGLILWFMLKKLTDQVSKSSFAIVSSLGFVFHSFLEGSATALSFGIDKRIGLLIAVGMLAHLLPEFFAITMILRGEGVSYKKSVIVDLVGVGVLFASFAYFYFLLPDFSEQTLAQLGLVSAGAFLYIGLISYLKRVKDKTSTLGLILGLLIVLVWK